MRLLGGIVALVSATVAALAVPPCDPLRFDGPQNLGTVESTDIKEASGLAASWRNSGVLWTHNDGPRDILYAIATDGRLLGKYHLNRSTDDVEDIAVGPGPAEGQSYLYAGDIGSNNADRTRVKIFRAPEPAVSTSQASQRFDLNNVDSFDLEYPGGNFDAEALLIDPVARQLFVITKEPDRATVFRIALNDIDTKNPRTLEFVAQIAFAKVSGGAVSRDGRFVALRREDHAEGWVRMGGEDLGQTLQRGSSELPVVGPPEEPNGEGIAFLPDSTGYLTLSEEVQQPLYLFSRIVEGGAAQFMGTPRVSPEGVDLQVSGCAGANMVLERSTDLSNWTTAGSFQANGEIQTLRDSALSGPAFYRLRTQ